MLLAVPNVSEGRNQDLIDGQGDAFARSADLLDVHSDADHNRSVYTLAAEPAALLESLLEGAARAVADIDMRSHEGLHPCIGALDVCPVVWVRPDLRGSAEEAARNVAEALARDLELPVFLYGSLATSPERTERAHFRRGGLVGLAQRMAVGEETADLGPAAPHPTAGAVLVTARPPLVAFNLELDTDDLAIAHAVSAELRESGGGPPGVRAIGLALSNGRVQVSTNVEDPFGVPLALVVSEVERLAGAHGAHATKGELVGLAPSAAFEGFPASLPMPGFDPTRHLIESRLPLIPRL